MAIKSRSFSLISYLTLDQVSDVLLRHSGQIRAYAYIEHNKDLKEDLTPKNKMINPTYNFNAKRNKKLTKQIRH